MPLNGVPVQDVGIHSCLPIFMWAVMFICLCACPLVRLASVRIATANANVLFWETLDIYVLRDMRKEEIGATLLPVHE